MDKNHKLSEGWHSMKYVALVLLLLSLFFLSSNINDVNKPNKITSQNLIIRNYLGLSNGAYWYLSGKNVTVAIIDSGISNHNDIEPSRVLKFVDFVNEKRIPYDDYGHGTYIAGIIGANGKIQGIAPNVKFVILKVLDKKGLTSPDLLKKAIEWIIENKNIYNIKIVNISLGVIPTEKYQNDSLCEPVEKLKNKDSLIVCSSGNDGSHLGTVLSPGISKGVITVGSIKNNHTYDLFDDEVTSFSSFDNFKPDIVSLGVDILSLDNENNNGYVKESGTSASAAIVSGACALLVEKYPEKHLNLIAQEILYKNVVKIRNVGKAQGLGELFFH